MMKKVFALIGLVTISFFWACEDESSNDVPVIPSNLTVTFDVADDGTGILDVAAQADDALRYELLPGNGEKLVTSDGNFNYAYPRSGTYVFEVRALGTAPEIESFSDTIEVEVIGYPDLELVWSDEFGGTTLSNDWVHELGDGCPSLCGWGNNELQYYQEANTRVANGFLTITAREESVGGRNYTSSRIITKGRQSFQFGRIDIRAQLPRTQGFWPALWMLGSDIDTNPWPACGEIDIMELVGGPSRDNEILGTAHWANESGARDLSTGRFSLPTGIFNDQFHVFSIIWDNQQIQWLMDDIAYHTVDVTPAVRSELRNDFFFIFNIAVGGDLAGSPDATSEFPQEMVVDYVRVFQAL